MSSEATRSRRIRVALADDSFLMREAVHQVVEHQQDVEIVADCSDGTTLLEEVRRTKPDVVVTDVRMPPSGDDEGIRVAQRLRETDPGIGVVVLSHYAEPQYGLDLFATGAEGRAYLLNDRVRDGRQLQAAIEVVARGGSMIDPEMVRLLLESEERAQDSPLAELTPRERVLAGRHLGERLEAGRRADHRARRVAEQRLVVHGEDAHGARPVAGCRGAAHPATLAARRRRGQWRGQALGRGCPPPGPDVRAATRARPRGRAAPPRPGG